MFETNDDHNHFHLMEIARYSLWNAFRTAEAAPAMKVGFCLLDSEPVEADENEFPTYLNESFCQAGRRAATSVMMGVSAGWRDIYPSGLAFQWVDVSDVQPGIYWLRSEVDPDGFVREQEEVNPASFAASATTIPGYVAQPVGGTLTAGRSTTVTLRANSFGNARALQFRIDVPPTCGDLDRPTGAWSSDATVTYTPGPGCSRSDGFQFSARDATSAFPRNPTRAGVLLAATAPGPQPDRARRHLGPRHRGPPTRTGAGSLRHDLGSAREAGHWTERAAVGRSLKRVAGGHLERRQRARRQLARGHDHRDRALHRPPQRAGRAVRERPGPPCLRGQRIGADRDHQAGGPEARDQPQATRRPPRSPRARPDQAQPHRAGAGQGHARAQDRRRLSQDAGPRRALVPLPGACQAWRAPHQAQGPGHDDRRQAHGQQAHAQRSARAQQLARRTIATDTRRSTAEEPPGSAQPGASRQSCCSRLLRGSAFASIIPSTP